jgi:hypothetical protein
VDIPLLLNDIWFAFLRFLRHSSDSFVAGTCCPLAGDALGGIWTLQGFLEMQKSSLLKGY